MSPNRFKIFEEIESLVALSNPYFKHFSFNPFDVLISQIYIQTIHEYSDKKSYEYNSKPSDWLLKKGYKIQIVLKRLKDFITYGIFRQRIPENMDVLFFPVEPTHIKQFKVIFSELEARQKPHFIVTNRLRIYKQFKDSKKSIFLYKKFPIIRRHLCLDMLDICDNIIDEKEKHDGFKYLKREVIKRVVNAEVKNLINMSFSFEEIINSSNIRNVFVGNDLTAEGRLLTIIAKRFKSIRTFSIMHGNVSGSPMQKSHLVDTFFLYGEAARFDLIKMGADRSKLMVCGAPYMDIQPVTRSGINRQLINELRFNEISPYVLIANSGPGNSTSFEHYHETLRAVFSLASKLPYVQWVIKLHRKDNKNNFEKVLKQFPDHNIHIIDANDSRFEDSVFTWLQGAKCLLTGVSTVALEAMAMDIPVVSMDFMNEYDQVDFLRKEAVIIVRNSNELERAVMNLIGNTDEYNEIRCNAKTYVEQFFFKGNLKASEYIVAELI